MQERREKTRLRVARWRAKRKLQAYLNQTQVRERPPQSKDAFLSFQTEKFSQQAGSVGKPLFIRDKHVCVSSRLRPELLVLLLRVLQAAVSSLQLPVVRMTKPLRLICLF